MAIKFQKGSFLILPNKDIAMKLRGAALNVYLALCAHADKDGGCYPSYKRLQDETGYSERPCIKAIEELEKIGLIKKTTRKRNDGSLSSNYYQLMVLSPTTGGSVVEDRGGSVVHDTPLTIPVGTIPNNLLVNTNRRDKRDPGVQQVIDCFELETGIKQPATVRRYAYLLIKRFGLEQLLVMVRAVAAAQRADKFCPRTPTLKDFFYQKEKLQDYFQRRAQSSGATVDNNAF